MGIEITYRKKQDAMKKVIFLLFCLLVLSAWSNAENADDTFTVYQMNLWHEGSKVPNGYQGILDVLDEVDADVVFLCEIRNFNGKMFMPRILEDLKKRISWYQRRKERPYMSYSEETAQAVAEEIARINRLLQERPEQAEETYIPPEEYLAQIKGTMFW